MARSLLTWEAPRPGPSIACSVRAGSRRSAVRFWSAAFRPPGSPRHGAGGGTSCFITKSRPGNLALRVTELSGTAVRSAGQYEFKYQIIHGSGASSGATGSGTLVVTLQPINTNIQGKPVSNPGFFGNATFTFS